MHNKKYDQYYLFLDSEIILVESFSKKIYLFAEKTYTQQINIEYTTFNDHIEEINIVKLLIENDESFFNYLDSEIIVGNNKISPFVFNLVISDENKQWSLFLSFSEEYGLFGCPKDLNNLFLNIFNPYEELNPQKKLEIICDRFIDDFERIKFINYIKKMLT